MEFKTDESKIFEEKSLFLEEEEDEFEVAGTWATLGTFGSSVGGCASSYGTASSFG